MASVSKPAFAVRGDDLEKDHARFMSTKADGVSDWVGTVVLGRRAPAAFSANESVITAACATPLPSD